VCELEFSTKQMEYTMISGNRRSSRIANNCPPDYAYVKMVAQNQRLLRIATRRDQASFMSLQKLLGSINGIRAILCMLNARGIEIFKVIKTIHPMDLMQPTIMLKKVVQLARNVSRLPCNRLTELV
jgi:hypothetical protein